MPTLDDRIPGFFQRFGAKLDLGVAWVKQRAHKIRETYCNLNSDYVKRLRAGKILRILPPSLIVLAFFFITAPALITKVVDSDMATVYDGLIGTTSVPTEPLYAGEVSQEIRPNYDVGEVREIGVIVFTFMRENDADYEFVLKKDTEVVYSQSFSAKNLRDGAYYYIHLDQPLTLENDNSKYFFSIRAIRADKDNAVAFFRNTETEDLVYSLSVRSDFYTFIILTSIIFLFVFFAINYLINSGKLKTELYFLASILAYVIPITFLYPAYTTPDEPYHFLSAVRLAEYDWSKSADWNTSRTELALPSNRQCLGDFFANTYTPGLMTMERALQCFEPTPTTNEPLLIGTDTSRILAYLPSAIGIIVGDLFFDSPSAIYYAGRLANMVTTVAIIAFALSLLKKHRMLLLAVVCIPMFIQQAISYSYDGLLNALCLVIIAYAIRFLATDANVRKRDMAIIAVVIFLIGVIKLPYVAVAAPFLAVKAEKFGKHKITKWLLAVTMLIIAITPYFVDANTPKVASDVALGGGGRGFALNTLIQQPLVVAAMIFRTFEELTPFYITSTIGNFGWFDFRLDNLAIFAYFAFLLIVALSDEENSLPCAARILTLPAILTIVGSLFLIMYLTWTPTYLPFIEGVQGRYFLPLIPLTLLAIIPRKRRLEVPVSTLYSFINVILLTYIVTLIVGFY